ncbi:zinc finger and BTB domain-containing protein 41 [Bombina bombina]|uniref:zinc finger and BTB domain-containing protein 41 n=1 Tax=Bombina bombina TaxID=8345 RepID=UPI00235AC56A|nr:zinc finger and BTB domain-containing protein 41 [Bombina bombina]XP_053549765.1 zinc finger and BTB domain-containing protein 41 [Bombina bombina]XP_053549766.1 zinc finger and BTB domain-containing protein 41 [Bombina bombina]
MKKRRKVAVKPNLCSSHENPKELPASSASEQCNPETLSLDRNTSVCQALDQRKLFSSLNYNRNLLKYLNDDRQRQTSFCDLVIVVEGKEFHVHKVVVAVGSSYFHACLSKNPQLDTVTLDHVSSLVFQHLLEFLYTSEFLVLESEIRTVLEAAKFLDIIDAVKLLANENDLSSSENQPLLDVGEEPVNKLENSHKCELCDRHFCYRKTLENHMGKAHGLGKTDTITGDFDLSTRKSQRRRKCPVKFENEKEQESDCSSNSDTSRYSQDRTEIDESESEMNGEVNGQEDDREKENGQGEAGGETSAGGEELSDEDLGDPEEPNDNSDIIRSFPDELAPIILNNSGKKMLKCPKCEKVFDRVGKYESHTRVHTGEKPFECDVCHQRYSTKSNLTVHKKRHSSDTIIHQKEHKCPCCNKLHASRKTLAKHMKRFHPENSQEFLAVKKLKSESWKCDVCNKSFTRRPHLQEHMILHSQDKPFKCSYCEEHFKSRFPRLKHQEKHHLGPFPCDICGRPFNDTGNLKRHIEYTHGGKRKWTCFICGKSVRERTTLKEHMRIHSGEKPHLCSICGQSFRHGSSYRLHLRVHHDDKRYECNDCGKSFIRHDHLAKHRKIHSGEKEHQCEECGKCFGRRDHLTVHYKSVHLGEKVWQKYKATFHQCEVCKKVFKGKSSLEMHFRTHSGEKPYKCHVCNQSFRVKKTLTKHLVIHSDARPFNCQYCSATFKRKDKLKYHIDHVHGSKSADEDKEPASEEQQSYPVETQSVETEICVPLTLVPVEMSESEVELEQHTDPALPTSAEFQRPTDLSFLEKYTLTPQPATLLHPVRSEQILEGREHTYLGTLLGLDPQPPVQNITTENP